MRRAFAVLGLAGLAAAGPLRAQSAAPAFQQVSQKFDYKPVKQIQAIQLALDKVQVRQIVFAPASEAGGKQRHSVPEAVLSIDNEGTTTAAVGVAIAIFDAEGNLLAAGAGGARQGFLAAGERGTASIRFPFVYRNLDKARTFLLTLEIQPRPAKGEESAPPGS
ncbi:MAG TPA: hypothetical protein VGK26_08695 [Thermoanaerobaculia bacterium]|jgi:hypothetical protein